MGQLEQAVQIASLVEFWFRIDSIEPYKGIKGWRREYGEMWGRMASLVCRIWFLKRMACQKAATSGRQGDSQAGVLLLYSVQILWWSVRHPDTVRNSLVGFGLGVGQRTEQRAFVPAEGETSSTEGYLLVCVHVCGTTCVCVRLVSALIEILCVSFLNFGYSFWLPPSTQSSGSRFL